MKSILKLLIIVGLLVFSNQFSFAQEADKTVAITVSGTGKTQDDAKQSAFRSAIEQAFGAFISSKTEILNDRVVADQIASVANGNIQSFSVLNESQLPDGSWAVTLKVIVSVSKLTSFVEAKGVEIEIKGGLFATNIKQQLLNEQGEAKAISEMVGLLHETMQIAFDYKITSGEPKSLDLGSKNWEIPLVVKAIANENMDFCVNYCKKTLKALTLSYAEVKSYEDLNKTVFQIYITDLYMNQSFNLRSEKSFNALTTLLQQWEFYTRLFTVQSGMDESNGEGEKHIHKLGNYNPESTTNGKLSPSLNINFLIKGEEAATFSWKDKRTLSQIEQMTGYKVKSRGVVSPFKNGGFIVYEANGHGLVIPITGFSKEMDWNLAKNACDELSENGYNDWRLPTIEELSIVHSFYQNHHFGKKVGNAGGDWVWSSTMYFDKKNQTRDPDRMYSMYFPFEERKPINDGYYSVSKGNGDENINWSYKQNKYHVKAVRSF